MKQVPLLDLGETYRELRPELDAAIARVLEGGWYILGPEVEAFEQEWAAYCGAAHAVGLANGLDALILALRALDVGPGHEVIVPSNTYIATWLAVSAVGATVVPVEPAPDTHNIDPDRIEAAITPATRVILPVHLYGLPADLDPILELARSRGLAVVEDAAQAHAARYRGRRLGGHGDLVCWSFYPTKNLGAFGDAGAVTTNRADLADRIRLLRNYGSRVRYVNEETGCNSRLDPIQAAILRVKLRHLDEWTARRQRIADLYQSRLAGLSLQRPSVPEWAVAAWHLYVVRVPHRDRIAARLSAAGVETLVHYPIPPHLQKAYAPLGIPQEALPIARQLATEVLSLPMGPHLSVAQAHQVVDALGQALAADGGS